MCPARPSGRRRPRSAQQRADTEQWSPGGGVLAMLVVYPFLGDSRRTLIIGTKIPIAIMVVVLMLMASVGLTLNIMTLSGLALGVGMLVDNTIVMLENVYRHQRMGKSADRAPVDAAAEVNSAIVADAGISLN